MTTASERRPAYPRDNPDHVGWTASLKRVIDRPLTSYQLVLGISAILLSLGLVMVLSASSVMSYQAYGNSYSIFLKQAMWVVAGLPLAWLVSRLPLRLMRWAAYPALLGSIGLIAMTYVPGLGVSVNGNQNWLSFGGPFLLQPSEIAKLAMVLWAADLYARKEKLLHDWKHLLIPMVPVTGLVALLTIGQHDLGTALVMFAVILGMLWIVGAPMRLFVGSTLVAACLAGFLAATDPERVSRLTTFLNPIAQIRGNGWQASHGFFALATGQFWGVGLGAGRQKWGSLPEADTDFIFAVIGEELGLFGTLVVLALFVLLAYTGLRIAGRTREPFVRYASAGITIWLLSQALINLGMVLGLLPVIGIPLPLISYGGSALLPTLIALGMLVSFAKTEPGARAALRAQRTWRGGQLRSKSQPPGGSARLGRLGRLGKSARGR
ncbi:MAG: putative lipid II flippase FtsW [Nocardioidaceae bacterium]